MIAQSNIAEFTAAFSKLNLELGRDTRKALRKEGRLLFGQVAQFTPPKKLAQGRQAVKRDILAAVQPLRFESYTNASIRKLIKGGNIAKIQNFLDDQKRGPMKGARAVRFSPSVHQSQRDRRGRVRERRGRTVTPDVRELARYIKRKQQNVGRARGGWVASQVALGGSPPAWARRWRALGSFSDRLNSFTDSHIAGTNRAEWAEGDIAERTVNEALRSRTVKLKTALEAAINGAAFKSLKA